MPPPSAFVGADVEEDNDAATGGDDTADAPKEDNDAANEGDGTAAAPKDAHVGGPDGSAPPKFDCEIETNRGRSCDNGDGEESVCFISMCFNWSNLVTLLDAAYNMVHVPPTSFAMGCVPHDKLCAANEQPRTKIKLSGFFVMKSEVSAAAYKECVDEAACTPPSNNCPSGPNNTTTNAYLNYGNPQYANHPVNCVTWHQARAYCKWKHPAFDVPTEAQFESLLRKGQAEDWIYPHGDAMPPPKNFANLPNGKGPASAGEGAHGNSPQNQLLDFYDEAVATWSTQGNGTALNGVHDLWGNVWEWTRDRVGPNSKIASENPTNPLRAVLNGNAVIRGAGFYYTGGESNNHYPALRSSYRLDALGPGHFKDDLGFRCVCDLYDVPGGPK